MPFHRRSLGSPRFALALALASTATPLCAQDVTWTGLALNGNISNPSNWFPAPPQDGDFLLLGFNPGNRYQVTLDQTITALSMHFLADATQAFQFQGGRLRLLDSIANASTFTHQFHELELTGNATLTGTPLLINTLIATGDRTLYNRLSAPLTLPAIHLSSNATPGNFTLAGNAATHITGPISNGPSAPSGTFTFAASGPLALSGASTYSGATSFGGTPAGNHAGATPLTSFGSGEVTLDFSAPAAPTTNILYNGAATPGPLSLGSAKLLLKGAPAKNNIQSFGNLTVNTGASSITLEPAPGGTLRLNLGTIARNAPVTGVNRTGYLNFNIPSGATVTTNSLNLSPFVGGILNTDVPVTLNDRYFVINFTNAPGGEIAPYYAYTNNNATFTGVSQASNVNVVTNASIAASTVISTLRFSAPSAGAFTNALTLGASGALYHNQGAILVTPDVGAHNVSIQGGFVIGAKDKSLTLINRNPLGALIINSVIANHTSTATPLNIVGPGPVTLGGANTYTGGTTISNTSLSINSNNNLGLASAGFPITLDDAAIKALANINFYNGPALTNAPRHFGLSSAGGTFDTNHFTLVIPGTISGPGAPLSIIGGGTAILLGANAHGDTFIAPSTFLQVGGNSTTGTAGTGTIHNQGNLVLFRSDDLALPNPISGTGNLAKYGDGVATLDGDTDYSGGTTIHAGTLAYGPGLHQVGRVDGAGTLDILPGASFFTTEVDVDHLRVQGAAQIIEVANPFLKANAVNALDIGTVPPPPPPPEASFTALADYTGRLDLTNNALVIRSANPAEKAAARAQLADALAAGRDAGPGGPGSWTGNGITSSTVAADTADLALALADNAILGYTSFRGQSVDANALLLAQATFGDATLDGAVDAFDLNLLANNWQKPANALWSDGDFTGDGAVDAFDLNLLAAHWQSATSLFASLAQHPGLSTQNFAAIPEPASLALLTLAAPLLARRRLNNRA